MTFRLVARYRGSRAVVKLLFSFLFLFVLVCVVLKLNSTKLEEEDKSPFSSNSNNNNNNGKILEDEIIVATTTAEIVGVASGAAKVKVTLEPIESNANKVSTQLKLVTQGGEDPDPEVNEKRLFVKRMMEDAWGEYEKYAWGANELMPISRSGRTGGDIYGNKNFGATIIDSLSTLYIMGMNEEFEKARAWIDKEFDLSKHCHDVSLFETNIRILGGFLSAFALSNDPMFLKKAKDVGERLLPAFDTPSGIPRPRVTLCHPQSSGGEISLAEVGSLHLEFVYLSILTKDYRFYDKVYKVRRLLRKMAGGHTYQDSVSTFDGHFVQSSSSIGGGADSFYEYLIKSWIQLGKAEDVEMYHSAIQAMIDAGMMKVSPENHFLYIARLIGAGQTDESFSHLACFAGAMFALGSTSDRRSRTRNRDMEIAKNLTNTCHESYDRAQTKLGPENFSFRRHAEAKSTSYDAQYYILRPEVIESYFTLYRLTGDKKYRDWGWEAALAIEKYCKAKHGKGYSGLRNVNNLHSEQDDVQQTFFLAETLKYLYLLFSSPDLISLDNWVFNTEAHPLPIKGKNPMFSPYT